jgi:tripartite-type tricarboxylate transporter receptor subunit TctC
MGRVMAVRHTLLISSALALVAGTFGVATSSIVAQQTTGKTIQVILPVAVASGIDTLTRAAQNELSKALGYPLVINNQPGAGGVIGTQQLVRSAPDGFTISVISNNHVIYPSVLKSVPFDPVADITPIATLGSTPLVLVVNPNKIPAKTAQDVIALLKSKPDQFNYGSSGNGTILHLAAAMFVDQAGVKATHIPYKGVGPLLTDLIGGQVDMAVLAYPSIVSHLKSGAIRAIGTGTAQRLAAAPEIPTMVEQGMPNYLVDGWFAVIAPAKLPPADVARIHAAFTAAFNSAEVKEAMAKQANTINIGSPEQAAQFIKAELAKYAAIVQKIGLEPQ